MDVDPGIICYQHCEKNVKVFTFKFSEICACCKKDISNSELRIPPFRIPYPFKNASRESNTIVIKPTVGDFLNTYRNSSDLHIGVTDSNGYVFEYDCNGKQRSNNQGWYQCLSIKLFNSMNSSFQYHWDQVLYKVFEQDVWSSERYDCELYNCYNFVLTFLKELQMESLCAYIRDKHTFCQHFVSPQARIAAKYISLYRQLKINPVVIQ